MNDNQKRLLAVMEFKFYELQVGKVVFVELLDELGLLDPRDSGDISTAAFTAANKRIRKHLRLPPGG